jgi:hypothetical protein
VPPWDLPGGQGQTTGISLHGVIPSPLTLQLKAQASTPPGRSPEREGWRGPRRTGTACFLQISTVPFPIAGEGMEMAGGDRDGKGGGGLAGKDTLARYLAVLTEGMTAEEAGRARETLDALRRLRAASPGHDRGGDGMGSRLKRAEGLPLDGRRRMLQEDALALEVGQLSGQVSANTLRVFRGECQVTPEMKKETRRAVARLGQLNAILVGRFPHLTPLLEEVSDAFLDAMYILGGGKGPLSNRLRGTGNAGEPAGKNR